MSDVLGIALSGLQTAGAMLSVTANNIANADTPGYQAQRPDVVELSIAGSAVAGLTTDPTPAPTQNGKEGSNVDVSTQAVDLTREKLLYNANAAVVKTADQMLGTLMNMFDTDHDGDSK